MSPPYLNSQLIQLRKNLFLLVPRNHFCFYQNFKCKIPTIEFIYKKIIFTDSIYPKIHLQTICAVCFCEIDEDNT